MFEEFKEFIKLKVEKVNKIENEEDRLIAFESIINQLDDLEDVSYGCVNEAQSVILDRKRYEEKLARIDAIRAKGIEVRMDESKFQLVKSKWIDCFAGNLTEGCKADIYMENVLWHICSYNKVKCYDGDAARKIFNLLDKENVHAFEASEPPQVLFYKGASQLKDTDFDKEYDFYVVDDQYTWTYIKTHASLGPYLIFKDELEK